MNISEQKMGIAFEKVLLSRTRDNPKAWLPIFDSVFKEVPSVQGIPDYIGVKFDKNEKFNRQIQFIERSYLSSASAILSLTKLHSARTEEYYITKTGLSKSTVRKTILYLLKKNILTTVDNKKKYVFSSDFKVPNISIWAFELKLENWKRAYFQAFQYKTFANYTVIVFPKDKENVVRVHLDEFKKMNIGIILFNPILCSYETLLKAKKSKPLSQRDALFMQGQLLNMYNRKTRIKSNQ